MLASRNRIEIASGHHNILGFGFGNWCEEKPMAGFGTVQAGGSWLNLNVDGFYGNISFLRLKLSEIP